MKLRNPYGPTVPTWLVVVKVCNILALLVFGGAAVLFDYGNLVFRALASLSLGVNFLLLAAISVALKEVPGWPSQYGEVAPTKWQTKPVQFVLCQILFVGIMLGCVAAAIHWLGLVQLQQVSYF